MKRTDAMPPGQEHDAHSDAAKHRPQGAPRRRHSSVAIDAPGEAASEDGHETTPPSVQFGRAKQGFRQRWAFLITFAMWCVLQWVMHGSPGMVGVGLVIAAIAYWGGKDLDHAARIEPGVAVLRTGGDEERIPAEEITAIRVEKTPGLLMHSVYIRIERGRFDSFDIMRAKAPDTPEGRRRLQTEADEALALLRRE